MGKQSPLLPLPLSTILKIQGDPRQWIQQKEPQLEAVSGKSIHEWGSVIRGLGFSYRHNVLVWSEVVGRRIRAVVLDRPGNHPVDLFTGTSSEVNGVAVDWINSNVYWTDGLYSWLVMAPLRFHPDPSPHVLPAEPLKRVFRIVVQDGLDNPRSVAVHPLYNWLLLSDRGVRPRIERTDLLGQNREVLVDRDMVAPTGLVIDMVSCRLFWADQVKATVESVLLRGPDRQRTVIFKEGGCYAEC
ncbi:low-density lipoprotein receptor 1-like [Babylonia areolata]|uniref:low-density lipoprotein receptor 1-like n=1 Tax=Babylonia areolata TaxID=304850 RepID=UPI003FD48E1A